MYIVNLPISMGKSLEDEKTEIRDVESFNSIDARDAYEIHVVCQEPIKVSVTAPQNVLSIVKTKVRNKVLEIRNTTRIENEKIRIDISMPTIEKMSSSGAHELFLSNVKGDRLDVTFNGAGAYQIDGAVNDLNIAISGAGRLRGRELHADSVKIQMYGAATAEVHADHKLDANVFGTGMISYYGDPKVINRNVTGVGVIERGR